ncbi:hypothetical protein FE392_19750 [Xenorhabdus sp. 12]|uniref:C2H2-type domain-containing protein n=1 Tax=Xenorhabdus santafensis TaxID=2582833 RepID=A0ABU4SFB8_9GAMM|nr:hypothetical protein [Xenorhabdus sp. 12]MDX7989488.1 hypothetical protein [Xenorhabdus sp. 12]
MFICQICNEGYGSAAGLGSHMRAKHPYQRQLQQQQRQQQQQQRPFKCNANNCFFSSDTQHGLDSHRGRKHPQQRIPSQSPNLPVSQFGGANYPTQHPSSSLQSDIHESYQAPTVPEYNQLGTYDIQRNPGGGIMRTQSSHPAVTSPHNAPAHATEDIYQRLRRETLSKYPGMWPPPPRRY